MIGCLFYLNHRLQDIMRQQNIALRLILIKCESQRFFISFLLLVRKFPLAQNYLCFDKKKEKDRIFGN